MVLANIAQAHFRRNGRRQAARAHEPVTPSPECMFQARCDARAILFAVGELELREAVDALEIFAVQAGLVDEIGQDAVQALMAKAFSKARADG